MVALGRVEPEVAKEYGLVPASRLEMLAELRTLFREWQPWDQAFFMNHGTDFSAIAGLLPGYFFAKNFSKILPGLSRARGRWLPIALPALVPGSLCGMTHQFCVSHDIYLQETSCSVCLETRATALQVTIGAWLPFLSSIAGTLILGQQMRYKWVPRSSSALLGFCQKMTVKSVPLLAKATLFQMLVAGLLVNLEITSYKSVLAELERRVEQDKVGIDGRLGHISIDRD